jgi:ribosomal protein L18E
MEIKEFDKWYNEVNNSNDKIKMLEFVCELIKTPYTEYYYSLMTNKNTNQYFKETLWRKFYDNKNAEAFLLDKLDKKTDMEFYGEIIYCLGKIIDQKSNQQKTKVLEYAIEFSNNSNEKIREKAIIVLGWLGGNKEIELLGNKLLNDIYNRCRAWSASSLMQISFRKKLNTEKVLPYLYSSIKQENDYFVIESVIDTLQEILKKSFGLRKKDLDANNIEAIEKSKNKVLKYFKKLYE